EADLLLPFQDVEDVAILDRGELLVRERRIPARLEQLERPQQAADLIRAIPCRHVLPLRHWIRGRRLTAEPAESAETLPQDARTVARPARAAGHADGNADANTSGGLRSRSRLRRRSRPRDGWLRQPSVAPLLCVLCVLC